MTSVLAIDTVTVTTASKTIQELLSLAAGQMEADTKTITLRPVGTVSRALGKAAVAGTNDLPSGAWYEMACLVGTDLRFIAAGSTEMEIQQEG